mgnify:CR=1 FL=1
MRRAILAALAPKGVSAAAVEVTSVETIEEERGGHRQAPSGRQQLAGVVVALWLLDNTRRRNNTKGNIFFEYSKHVCTVP